MCNDIYKPDEELGICPICGDYTSPYEYKCDSCGAEL